MRDFPKFSIIIATLNAERTLEKTLKAIADQDYPREKIEVLVIDGGSTDQTRPLAQKYGARVLDNPRVEPVSAKLLGLKEATGHYLIYCDADEVMENPRAIQKRALAFTENPAVKMVFATGYQDAPGAPFVSRFINEYGDPFSMFYYRLSKNWRYFAQDMKRICSIARETSDYTIYQLTDGAVQPIMENAAQANAMDLDFFRKRHPDLIDKPWGSLHFFYHMQAYTKEFAITNDDPVTHYSSENWRGYLRKIKWRIVNNIFYANDMGASGFGGRQTFDRGTRRARKYLFLPYAVLILPVFLDSLRLAVSRRDPAYIAIVPLCFFTATMILFYGVLSLFGYKAPMQGYGSQIAVKAPWRSTPQS